jgi:antitoxin (DNA-binding transcriptional repressor) of toxin-antitoxin stability system
LEITQDGETVAVISPVTRRKRAKFGMMKSRTKVLGDIVEPTYDLVDWDVW